MGIDNARRRSCADTNDEQLRLNRKGVTVAAKTVEFTFDGERLPALAGETIAAALAANGKVAVRQLESSWRGVYCGMGACYDCTVTIDGRMGQRACMIAIRGGEVVRSTPPSGGPEDPLVALAHAPEGKSLPERSTDVLVIGAGPAGLNAALAACSAGASVVVLDERSASGGQYFKPIAATHRTRAPIDRQFANGRALMDRVHEVGVEVVQGALVWGAFGPKEILALVNCRAVIYRPSRLVLATGAFERAMPFPGWTLPGVMTTGAVQTLTRTSQVVPGRRILVAGNGPLNFQLAADLASLGIELTALAESAQRPGYGQIGALARATHFDPRAMFDGARYLVKLNRKRVPIMWGHQIVRADGGERLRSVTVAPFRACGQPDLERSITLPADVLALGYGFAASVELARALGCEVVFDPRYLGSWRIVRDSSSETTVPGVFAVGDGARFGGATLAIADGQVAGRTVAGQLGFAVNEPSRRASARACAFQKALWELFAGPPASLEHIDDATVLCRCEDIDFGAVRREIVSGARSLAVLKRRLRLGMGRCQGRYCAMTAAALLRQADPNADIDFAPRLPVKPFPVAALTVEKPEWGGHERAPSPNLARPVPREPFGDIDAEIAIIGAGVVGACLAHECIALGRKVVVLDRDDANLQASGANAGSLHAQLLSFDFGAKAEAGGGPAADTLPLGPWSIRLWQELAEACGRTFEIRITGGLMVAESETGMAFLREKVALERRHGLDVEILGPSELRSIAPGLARSLSGAEYSPCEGKINPLTATYSVLDRARRSGVRFEQSANVNSIEREGSQWWIGTGRGSVRSPIVINAAGPWARQIGAMVGLQIPVHSAPLQMIVTERAPLLVDQLIAHADRHLSLKQLSTGGLVIGGAWTARYNSLRNMNVTIRESIEGNLWAARRVMPQLAGLQVVRTWAGMNVNIDGAPILGEVPDAPGFYNAVTSNGYTLAPAVARLTAELIDGRTPTVAVRPYLIDRFG
ncbi:MAG: FAD-dependent oxidoreductase [Hyphomicrobiaceae bacterium]